MVRKRLAAAVAMVALSGGVAVWAADNTVPLMLDTAPATPTTLTPIMYFLDPTPVGKWMENNKLSVTGFAEGGYFYDTSAPHMGAGSDGDSPTLISFPGGFSNRGVLDQVDMTVSKSLDTTKTWDYGFLVEAGYGIDDAQIHSFGVFDHRGGAGAFNNPQFAGAGGATGAGVDPDNQFDVIQANVSLLVPLGSGLTITAGKFIAFESEELISPVTNYFYSHSYSFFYGVPGTNTGVTGSYTFAKALSGNDVTVTAGATEGWNESTRDNNGAADFLGQVKGSLTPKLSYVLNLEEGPEGGQFSTATGGFVSDNEDYWTTGEVLLTYAYSDQLTFVSDSNYTDDPHGGVTSPTALNGVDSGHSNAQWYGEALYASYKINSNFTANLRGEWFRDQGAFATGAQANYYEATFGVDIHPFPNDNVLQWLQLRPEVRQDWSDRAVYNLNHDVGSDGVGGDHEEFTVAMDVFMQF